MLPRCQLSIRLTIISLFIFLLSLISFSIIGINHSALNKILSSTTKNLIKETTNLLSAHIHNHLQPLHRDLQKISNLLRDGIIEPSDLVEFDRFLLQTLRDTPQIFTLYYGTETGNLYGADRENQGHFAINHILKSNSPPLCLRYEYDSNGQFLKTIPLDKQYDPRQRPWYQEAVQARSIIWTDVYSFVLFGGNNQPVSGMTAALPVYDKQGELMGVLGMDLTLETIQEFISRLKLTPHSRIFVTDNNNRIVAYKTPLPMQDLRGQVVSPEYLAQINLPKEAIAGTQEDAQVLSFTVKNEEYFIINQAILHSKNMKPWHITIIVPASDILAPLDTLRLHSLAWTLLVLLLGSLLARYISQKISQPIIKIAKQTEAITELDLRPCPPIMSRIKEICFMDKSLANMRASLLSFQRYVPASLVKQLMQSGEIAQVEGQKKFLTILFSDIRNFTQLAEDMPPEELMVYLSNYFQSMTEAVIEHHGMLDKYIGDAVMALWNTPLADKDHALHACQAAVDMIKRVNMFNESQRSEHIPQLYIRIGIHSGEVVVGNVGSEERLSYTALGDSVNLASRLEAINKNYHTKIIVSEAVYQQVYEHFPFRLIDEVAVRGKHRSTKIYELITEKNIHHLEQHQQEFIKAFSLYQLGDWEKALGLFKTLTPAYANDQLALVYLDRCAHFLQHRPPYWDGIWRITAEENF